MAKLTVFFITVLSCCNLTFAQVPVNDDGATQGTSRPPVGTRAAEKYMGVKPNEEPQSSSSRLTIGKDTHFLAIHLGTFVDDVAYNWGGPEKKEDIGSLTAGVSYRVGEWVNSMDLLFRGDFNSYKVTNDGRAIKLSLLPVITFPDAASEFPLYFGAGLGLGIFFKQLDLESSISMDYQIFGGIRFLNVIDTTGFFVEVGLKNHVHLLSDGQFNGLAVSLGSVFSF